MSKTSRHNGLPLRLGLLAAGAILFGTARAGLGADAAYDERIRINQQRQKETQTKNEEMKRLLQQAAELRLQGKYEEAARVGDQMREKHGVSPASVGLANINRASGFLKELGGIRDKRSARFRDLFRQYARMSMPIVGEVEFAPAIQWRELTMRRSPIKLSEKEQKLVKALETPITTSFKGQTLEAVLTEFEKQYAIKINVDRQALVDAGLSMESPVAVNVREKSLRSTLKNMLGDIGLTFVIANGELRVTTPQLASMTLTRRSYYIGDLTAGTGFGLDPLTSQLQAVQSIASLLNMIQSIEPASWQSGGGPGVIAFNPAAMTIVVNQSAEMHFMLQGQFGR